MLTESLKEIRKYIYILSLGLIRLTKETSKILSNWSPITIKISVNFPSTKFLIGHVIIGAPSNPRADALPY